MSIRVAALAPAPILLLGACAPDLRTWVVLDDGPQASERSADSQSQPNPDGALDTGADLFDETELVIDATDYEAWVHYDFERRGVVEDDLPWELAFQRYVVQLNGGVSGDGGVEVAVVDTEDWDGVEVPADGWQTDAPDDDEDGVPERAFDDWYLYDSTSHVLTPRPLVYVVRSAEGRLFKLQILDYYDEAGTPGFLSLRWAELSSPDW